MSRVIGVSAKYKNCLPNIWVKYAKLATDTKSLNFGQGFPNYLTPKYITKALSDVGTEDDIFNHQYTRSTGHPNLVKKLSEIYSPVLNRKIDENSEILVSNGAYPALKYAIEAFVDQKDEVIIIEPFFDCYEPMVELTGAKVKYVSLKYKKTQNKTASSSDWSLDYSQFEKAFTNKTKAVVLNNPNNPIGKVYTKNELEFVSQLCVKNNVLCITDEVYEWMTYNEPLIKMATLPGMWERTLTIGSAGKTFSVTGWKTGWCIAPAEFIKAMENVHNNFVYTCPTPLQVAIFKCFEKELAFISSGNKQSSYLYSLSKELIVKRDRLFEILSKFKFNPILPEGGYFMLADISEFDFPYSGKLNRDVEFVDWMAKTHKLSLIPTSVFYSKQNGKSADNYVRFCFIKDDQSIDKLEKLLESANM